MNGARSLALLSAALLAAASPAAAQRALVSPAGDSLTFDRVELRTMLDTARTLYADLEEDPRVLYVLGFGPAATSEAPAPAYPWVATLPTSDSTVNVTTPGNLREADRAYHNYAVLRMRVVRGSDPDDPCDVLVADELAVLSAFVDGWILSRTLFGGPAFAPLDEFVFARRAGHLPALLASRGDASIGVCADAWADAHSEEVRAYESWRAEAFPELHAVLSSPSEDAAEQGD